MKRASKLTAAHLLDHNVQHGEDCREKLCRIDISISEKWILATDTVEFLCDLATFDIFFRPIVTIDTINQQEAEMNYRRAILSYGTTAEGTTGNSRIQYSPRGQVCNWKLWTMPDDTNMAAQIVLTSPDGEVHYLIAPETFRDNLEQRKRWLKEDYQSQEKARGER